MAGAQAGIVGQAELNTAPGTGGSLPKSPAFWTWFWFGLAIAVILGFHIRVFGVSVGAPAPSL